jgi:hypothetical protein
VARDAVVAAPAAPVVALVAPLATRARHEDLELCPESANMSA